MTDGQKHAEIVGTYLAEWEIEALERLRDALSAGWAETLLHRAELHRHLEFVRYHILGNAGKNGWPAPLLDLPQPEPLTCEGCRFDPSSSGACIGCALNPVYGNNFEPAEVGERVPVEEAMP